MGKKILLADDSLTIQKVVELTLSGTEYELACVSNGQQALESLRDSRPDLILADTVMPEKNGYEVCEAVKGSPATARIPVVLLSGIFEPFDRERAERIGCNLVVSKPFDAQQLLEQIESLLARATSEPPPPPPSEEDAPFATPFLEEPGATPPEIAPEEEPPFRAESEPAEAGPLASEPPPGAAPAEAHEAAAPESVPPVEEPLPPLPEPRWEEPAAQVPIEAAFEDISAEQAEVLFDVPAPSGAAPPPAAAGPLATAPASTPSSALTEEEIERIAALVIEKLTDRVIREIVWEVVPDVAEVAVKRRIAELESGAE
jgi:CheY-like chemotaxis protein